MQCPRCKSEHSKVTGTVIGLVNERFRKCCECAHNFQTVEAVYADRELLEYKNYLVTSGALDFTLRAEYKKP